MTHLPHPDTARSSPPATINWRADYERQQHGRFQRAITHVQTHKQQPDVIKPHFYSLLTLLDRADGLPSLLPMRADLIMNLRPLPKLWGFWDNWLRVCRWGADLLAQLDRKGEQAWLLADIIEILFELGRYEDGLAMAKTLFAIARADGVIRPLLRGGHTAVTRLILIGRQQEGVELYQHQCNILADLRSTSTEKDYLYAETLLILQETLIMRRQNRPHEALPRIEIVLANLSNWLDAPLDLWRDVYHHQGGIFLANSLHTESVSSVEKAISYAIQMGDEFYEASLYADLSLPLWKLGQFGMVEDVSRRSILLCEKLNADWRLSCSLGMLSESLLLRKQLNEALVWIERRIQLAEQLGEAFSIYTAHTIRGIIYLMLEQVKMAEQDLKLSEEWFQKQESMNWLSMTESNLSWCYADMGDVDQAILYAHRALTRSQKITNNAQEALALRSLSRVQTGAKRVEILRRSLELTETHDKPFDQAATLFLLVEATKNEEEKKQLWHQAVALLKSIKAEAWLIGYSWENPPCLPLIA